MSMHDFMAVIGYCVSFAGVVTLVFYLIGLCISYCWHKVWDIDAIIRVCNVARKHGKTHAEEVMTTTKDRELTAMSEDKVREDFEEAVRKLFGTNENSLNRDSSCLYYNVVSSNTFNGRRPVEYAAVSMLWEMWQAALSSSQVADMPEVCEWTADDEGTWQTACGQAYVFNDGSPKENGAYFCHHCGKHLKEIFYVAAAPGDAETGGEG